MSTVVTYLSIDSAINAKCVQYNTLTSNKMKQQMISNIPPNQKYGNRMFAPILNQNSYGQYHT